uniref:Uncharacterized protein n=1 Tax=Anguilla anguilla TaxID=7936 RepID=A0A0E9TFD1_ANGAN
MVLGPIVWELLNFESVSRVHFFPVSGLKSGLEIFV